MKQQPLTVFKDARGRWRWMATSSSAFRNREDQIVSTQALADDVARADAAGQYGPLLWWHEPTLVLGDADFNAMDGLLLVESGTFRDERVGAAMAALAPQLEVSIAFDFDAESEPDADGVYHAIRRFERSIVPKGEAINPFTSFRAVSTKERRHSMDQKKLAALREMLGDEAVDQLLRSNADIEKRAALEGVEFKDFTAVRLKDAPGWPAGVPFGDVEAGAFTAWYNSAVVAPILDMIEQVRAQFVQPAPELRSAGSRLSDTQAPMPATKAAESPHLFDPMPALAGGRLDQLFGGAFDHTPHLNGRS